MTPPPLRLLHAAYHNLLEIWEEKAFEYQFFSTRLLSHRIYICNSPDTVRHVLVTNNASFERKSPQMRHALAPLLGDGLFVSDGDIWRSRRPAVQSAVHAAKLPLFAPTIVDTASEMADRWERKPPDQVTDILSEMGFLTSEIISRTIFGKTLGAAHAREIVEGFADYQRDIGQMDFMSLIGLPDWLPRPRGLAVGRSAKRIRAAMDETIRANRDADEAGGPSLLQLLAKTARETTGRELDADALRNEASTLFMAGHETTANSLTWAWFLLSQAPEVEARLHRELDDVLAGRPPGLADFARLPLYSRRVRGSDAALPARADPVAPGPCATRKSAAVRSRPARWCWSCRGCCTATSFCGTSPIISSRSASSRRTARAMRNMPISPSRPARASAPAPPSRSPRPCCASPSWRSASSCA